MVLKLDYTAIGKILRIDMRKPIDKLARKIADAVDVGSVADAKVSVLSVTTDRAHAVVTIMHPAGMAMQAKYGSLTKAAASVGLEVKSKGGKK